MRRRVRLLAGRVDTAAGSHLYHLELASRLAARGHEVSVVCFGADPGVRDHCAVVEVPPDAGALGPFTWRFEPLLRWHRCARGLRRAELPACDVCIGGEHLFLKAHSRRFPRVPWIYLPHSLVARWEIASYGLPPVLNATADRLYDHLQRWALKHADRTLRFTRRSCEILAGCHARSLHPRFVVNEMGVSLPPVVRVRRPEGLVRLLFVGRLVASKNVGLILESLAGLGRTDWRLDIVGDGQERGALEAMASSLGLLDQVAFRGHQRDPGPWYGGADLFVFPSKLENCPIVVLEAMSHAVPCLGIRSDGVDYLNPLEEVIDHERTGLLAKDEADFGRQIGVALERPDRLDGLGRAAREHVAERHTWDAHLERYAALFEEMIAEGRRGRSARRAVRYPPEGTRR